MITSVVMSVRYYICVPPLTNTVPEDNLNSEGEVGDRALGEMKL